MDTPVLLILFNRPIETRSVFEILKILKPKYLYVACDGPRENNEDDVRKVMQTREIISSLDWPCELKTLYREKNLGCKIAVSEAISWFFKNIEAGIILEDDCVPDLAFFDYCTDLLKYYWSDQRVMHISGLNFLSGPVELTIGSESYHFSKYPAVWGWATWRRAWELYEVELLSWPEAKAKRLHHSFCFNKHEVMVREMQFDAVYDKQIDTWDYQWVYCISMNNGLCITPNTNLITNIGFNDSATHTFFPDKRSYLGRGSMTFPITHPEHIIADFRNDLNEFNSHIYTPFYKRFAKHLLKMLGLYRVVSRICKKHLNFCR